MPSSPLRPDPDVLGRDWNAIVEAEYAQTERVREWQETDYYRPLVGHFVDDPHRAGDGLLNELRSYCDPTLTWLDIGAGGGRNALALALLSKQVIAVEPSEAMRAALEASARQYAIENIEISPLRWPDGSEQVQADYTLMAHVGYDIREINAFLDALEHATRRRCFASLMDRAPSSGFERFWPLVHGEERIVLPAMREFVHLLLARGATPEVRIYARDVEPHTPDELRRFARLRLWLEEGSEKDQVLQRILDQELRDGIGNLQTPHIVSLISWVPPDRG